MGEKKKKGNEGKERKWTFYTQISPCNSHVLHFVRVNQVFKNDEVMKMKYV